MNQFENCQSTSVCQNVFSYQMTMQFNNVVLLMFLSITKPASSTNAWIKALIAIWNNFNELNKYALNKESAKLEKNYLPEHFSMTM